MFKFLKDKKLSEYKIDMFKEKLKSYQKETERLYIINDHLRYNLNKYKNENENLVEENKRLKERIEYLERSNNRREDTILGLRQEINNSLDDEYPIEEQLEEALKYRDIYYSRIYKALEYNNKNIHSQALDNILRGEENE